MDCLYQILDRKISIIIQEVKQLPNYEEELINSINESEDVIQNLNIGL